MYHCKVLIYRSYEPELLDADNIPKHDLYQNLIELNTINTLLGGHAVTLKGLKAFNLREGIEYTVLDIGCGGGDNLRYLAKWARQHNIRITFTGVDLKADCINFAQEKCADYPEIIFRNCDYRDLLSEDTRYDIIFTALFCHHFKEEDLITLFRFKQQKSKLGFFMNDLHRHVLAYYAIACLTQLFSNSYLVKNDAKLSVARGFKRTELLALVQAVGSANMRVKWVWAFRWLLVYKKRA